MATDREAPAGAVWRARAARVARAAAALLAPADTDGSAPVARPTRWDPTLTSEWYTWARHEVAGTRPQYLWPLLHAAHAARALGLPRIAALEFGVAGGNGLLALEQAAAAAGGYAGTGVDVVGFDTGSGMPVPAGPKDSPWLVEPALFDMDEQALRARLTSAQLVLGPVAETVSAWAGSGHAPVGFIAFDLDYYSSTVDAFGVLSGDPERLMPRTLCYFDDVFGLGWTDFTGERAAIDEFNAANEHRKIAKIHGLRFELPADEFNREWHEKMYVVHVFDHPRYEQLEGRLDERWRSAHRLPSE